MIEKCPVCHIDISGLMPEGISDKDINFCPDCGANFRYSCPVCRNGIISIMGIEKDKTMRCSNCGSLFYACEKCGRLAQPSARICPDEECRGLLIPMNMPSSLYNGTGFCSDIRIDFSFTDAISGGETPYSGKAFGECESLHAATASGGLLYEWHDSLIDVYKISGSKNEKIRSISASGCEKGTIKPEISVLGDNIVLSCRDRFEWFNLNGKMDFQITGEPFAICSGCYGAAVWVRQDGVKKLFAVLTPPVNSLPSAKEVHLPDERAQIYDNQMVMSHHSVYWQGTDGNMFKYDFIEESIKEIPYEAGFADFMWTDHEGKFTAGLYDSVKLSLTEDLEGEQSETFKSFDDYVTGLFADPENSGIMAYLLDNRIMKNGEGKFTAPNGDHVQSVFARDENEAPVLISLFINNQMGNLFTDLYAQKKDSNIGELIWSCPDIEPLGIVCAEGRMFVLHSKGIIELERKDKTNVQQ